MKTTYLIILLYFISFFTYAQIDSLPNTAYKTGEKLEYLMYYGWLDGGKATLTLEETYYDGQKVHHCKAIAHTIGMADRLFKVYDVYESYFDIETAKPLKAIRNLREDTYRAYNEVTFDHENNKVNSQKKGEVEVPKNIYDVVSAFYYARRTKFDNLKNGDIIRINTYFHDEPWELVVKFKGYETIELDIGELKCMKFIPIVEEGVFTHEEALRIWVSADKNYIPVRAEMEFFIGSFKTDLVNYSGLKNELVLNK